VRLHGRNYKDWFDSEQLSDRYNYLYTRRKLEGWAERVRTVSKSAEKTFLTQQSPRRQSCGECPGVKTLAQGKQGQGAEVTGHKMSADAAIRRDGYT
jgi:uncharacterized protein YecE (DUF72 family)